MSDSASAMMTLFYMSEVNFSFTLFIDALHYRKLLLRPARIQLLLFVLSDEWFFFSIFSIFFLIFAYPNKDYQCLMLRCLVLIEGKDAINLKYHKQCRCHFIFI